MGRDTTIAGAHLEGERLWLDVNGDLTTASLQDHYESKSFSWSAGADVTVWGNNWNNHIKPSFDVRREKNTAGQQ